MLGNKKSIQLSLDPPPISFFYFFLCSGIRHQNKLSCDWDVSIPVHLELLRLSVQLWVTYRNTLMIDSLKSTSRWFCWVVEKNQRDGGWPESIMGQDVDANPDHPLHHFLQAGVKVILTDSALLPQGYRKSFIPHAIILYNNAFCLEERHFNINHYYLKCFNCCKKRYGIKYISSYHHLNTIS